VLVYRRVVSLTVFRKTRQHGQQQIDRTVRAQKTCEHDHPGSVSFHTLAA
jgi:hypothetical protein